jgi:hypothetical protein
MSDVRTETMSWNPQDSRIVLTNSELVERGETTSFDSTDEREQTKTAKTRLG